MSSLLRLKGVGELLAFEIDRSERHPALWEKKGFSLYTVTNVSRYPALRTFANRLLNKIKALGGFVIHVGGRTPRHVPKVEHAIHRVRQSESEGMRDGDSAAFHLQHEVAAELAQPFHGGAVACQRGQTTACSTASWRSARTATATGSGPCCTPRPAGDPSETGTIPATDRHSVSVAARNRERTVPQRQRRHD